MSDDEAMRDAVAKALGEADGVTFSTEGVSVNYEAVAGAAISAVYAWLDANGWAVVPKEITADMERAADRSLTPGGGSGQYALDAFIAAAPKAPGA